MFKRLILTALVLGVSVVLFSQVSADTLPEKYVKKVIIDAKWGNGPGEFGYDPSGPGFGPESFTIDSIGNLYILDDLHGEVKKYDNNGKIIEKYKNEALYTAHNIVVDDVGNMYIYTEFASKNEILRYSIKNGFIKSFWFPMNDTSYHTRIIGNRMVVISKGRMKFDSKSYGKNKTELLKSSDVEHMSFQRNGNIVIRGYNKKETLVIIDIPKKFSDEYYALPRDQRISIGLYYLGKDKRDNRYFYCSYSKKHKIPEPIGAKPKVKEVIYKYSSTGKLLAMVVLPEPEVYYYEGLTPERGIKVDKEGSIYAMIPYKDGLRIYKFIQK